MLNTMVPKNGTDLSAHAKQLSLNESKVGCEGLELHILHWPHMDSIDLDPQPILLMGSEIY
jgi:hypothetical protein